MPTQEDFERFESYYGEAKQQVDDRITEILEGREEFATKRRLLEHSMSGGKRVRPVLTLLASEVYDSPYAAALNHAAIVELIHNASLVADDAYDEDAMRRGAPTMHKLLDKLPFGERGHKAVTGMTVMGSNGMVALAFELATDPDVLQAMGKSLRKLVDGFFQEGTTVFDGVLAGGYDRYIEVNKAKTGGLFMLASSMPADYVDAGDQAKEAARQYGDNVGVLYQVADDIADDDLPSYIQEPTEELEKWYNRAVECVDDMPESDRRDLLRVAPAWMVNAMLEQEDARDEVDPGFLPTPQEA